MLKSFANTERFIKEHVAADRAGDVMIAVGTPTESYHFFHSSRGDVLNEKTLCDMMSITKIVATTSLCLIAIDEGKLRLETTLADVFDGVPEHLNGLTVKQLMTHTSGLRHSFLPVSGAPYTVDEAIKVQWEKKLFSVPGEEYCYCCNNMLLLAFAIEKIYNKPFDVLFNERVATPLGLEKTHFLCYADEDRICNTRQERSGANLCDDPSAHRLCGVAGNAGIFSCLSDMEKFARSMLDGHSKIISKETFDLARKNHTENLSESRGLGFLYVDSKYPQTGRLFSDGSIGHCGHSGTSVFVDFEKQMYVTVLSNTTLHCVRNGGTYSDTMKFRADIHNAIADDLGI